MFCILLQGCRDIGTGITDGAIESIYKNKDSIKKLTAALADTLQSRAVLTIKPDSASIVKIRTEGLFVLDTVNKTAIALIDTSGKSIQYRIDSIFDRIANRTLQLRTDLIGKSTRDPILEMRDSVLGKTTRNMLKSIIKESAEESAKILAGIEQSVSNQRDELKQDIKTIILISSASVLIISLILIIVYTKLNKYKKAFRTVTTEVNRIENSEARQAVLDRINQSANAFTTKQIQKATKFKQ
jgi:hypothetical protein